MLNLLAVLLSSSAALTLSSACPTGRAVAVSSWSVQLKTSGGLAGRGVGNVLITSAGRVRYEMPEAPNRRGHGCDGKLSREKLRHLGELIGESDPGGWKVSGPNAAAADAVGYELELKARGGRTHKVTWYDNTREGLPEDLRRLYEEVSRVIEGQARKCSGESGAHGS